jgi:hypothetical protein
LQLIVHQASLRRPNGAVGIRDQASLNRSVAFSRKSVVLWSETAKKLIRMARGF